MQPSVAQCAIDQAYASADETWKAATRAALERTAKRLPVLTIDDVWDDLGDIAQTRDKRAVGGVLMRAAKDGIIEPTEATRSIRPASRSRSKSRIWRSKVYVG